MPITPCTVAATGKAKIAPTPPNVYAPNSVENTAMAGCISIVDFVTLGLIK